MAATRVAVVGSIHMDMVFQIERLPAAGESLQATSLTEYPGGKGANIAVALQRACHVSNSGPAKPSAARNDENITVYLNGSVGKDKFGSTLLENLRSQGVDTSGVFEAVGQPSGNCAVIVEKSGVTRQLAHSGANLFWTPKDPRAMECLAGGSLPDLVIVSLSMPLGIVQSIIQQSHEQGVEVLLDPSPVQLLTKSIYLKLTHLVANELEAIRLSGMPVDGSWERPLYEIAAQRFIYFGVKNVVITLAEKGAFFASQSCCGLVPAHELEMEVDSTGAGDTFVGIYALQYLRQKRVGRWDIESAVSRGCRAAAIAITSLGAQTAMPWSNELHDSA